MTKNARIKNAVVTLAVGLALNIALGCAKLAAGIISGSTSVASDAANNLSDAAVSIVTIIAMALSARAADREHPYGHGRYEYIATFILGAVIVAVGVEILRSGIERIITPVDVGFDIIVWATLGASIAVKAFMAVFYFVRGKMTGADTVKAAAVDSISDVAVTTVVLVCAVIEKFTGAHIDGYASIAVAVVVLVLAVRILKDTISRLLGERPDGALTEKISSIIKAHDNVISTHDIIINDYGETNKIAEADVVFPAEMSFVAVHAACDEIERRVLKETGVRLSVHADPHVTDDLRLTELTCALEKLLKPFDATAHDIAINDEEKRVELDVAFGRDGVPVPEVKLLVEACVRSALGYDATVNTDYI